MRSFRPLTMLVLATVLVAGACSSSSSSEGDGGGTTTQAPATTDAKGYIEGVCTALLRWRTGVEEDQQAMQTELSSGSSPQQSKDALVSFLDSTVDGTRTMVDEVRGLGAPDVEGGEQVASALSSGLGRVLALFEDALGRVEAVSVDDPQAMAQAFTQLGTDIGQGSSRIGEAFSELDAPPLEEAAKGVAACDDLKAA